jgi:hypothetical protein
MTHSEPVRTKLRPLAALAVVALIAAGCSNAAAGTGTSAANNTATNHEQAVKFAECMRSNGVSAFPDPNSSGELTIDAVANGSSVNPSTPAFEKALSACKNLEPAGFTGSKRSAQQQAAALKFAQCMRDSGVPDFPDPTPDGPLIDTNRIPSAAGRGARDIQGFDATAHKCTSIYSGELGLRGQ